ncbi:MAG TPA: cupin domain-containing protein [Vicinamibacteria bacterium]|nr:cupin domain-containing protein [Vicinamibacteria bacterium]
MRTDEVEGFQEAQVVLPCSELDETLSFFTERLGFRVEAIHPADSPRVAVVSGYGLRIQFERGREGPPGVIRLRCTNLSARAGSPKELRAPNGTRIELVEADPPIVMPRVEPSFVLSESSDEATWGAGRAGMRYRDLVPDRQGGFLVASHIQIPDGGPVPDYVHFHKIRFQMIYCYKGWVRVVYEDQGLPFVLEAGDCVLQPPRIRHRVLESSPGLEVIEIGCPADHETFADYDLDLPTPTLRPQRSFDGQRFVRHEAATAVWLPWRLEGFECRDTGIAAATGGLASVRVARRNQTPPEALCRHDAELLFMFVLDGSLELEVEGHDRHHLVPGTAFVLPASLGHGFSGCSTDLELLEVSLPAGFATNRV